MADDIESLDEDEKKMATNLVKFRLLMWKNFLIQYRHPYQIVMELLVSVLFSIALVILRSLVNPIENSTDTFYMSFLFNSLDPLRAIARNRTRNIYLKEFRLVYVPDNEIFQKFMTAVGQSLHLTGVDGVNTSSELLNVMDRRELIAGIEFRHSAGITTLPNNLNYTLRFPSECRGPINFNPLYSNWYTQKLYPTFSDGGPRTIDYHGSTPFYFYEGFLAVQDAMARIYTQMKCNSLSNCSSGPFPSVRLQQFPYPPHRRDLLLEALRTIVSLFILLSFIYPVINTVRLIAFEKERQLKETMKILGLPSWLHWTAWFTRTIILTLPIAIIMVILLKVEMTSVAVFTYSQWSILLFYLIIYGISMTTYCFMISVFFAEANTAAAVSGLVWIVFYVPFSFIPPNNVRFLACLFSNAAMAYGFQGILQYEGVSVGLQWSNLFYPPTIDDSISVGATMLFLILDSFIYLVIALYVEKVMPGYFGVPEKWNYPFTAGFWFGNPIENNFEDGIDDRSTYDLEHFEADPKNQHAGVIVKNLKKMYGGKAAVKGITFNMFDGQITVLLGHNGAGKTTTFSMMTGMIPPTSGTAIIDGYDIRTNLQKARSSIGLCPQHNILFDELTVREHLIFFATLKGLSGEALTEEVIKYVQLLELVPKTNSISSSLSGGMQRKLSVGVALCGGSKVVFLDEPTAGERAMIKVVQFYRFDDFKLSLCHFLGMDPTARRALWDLVQHEKKGRTILLTTHFMDEADVLGDRIAIMADGELKCCGTPFFLKKRFGTGYNLICVKNEDCNTKKVTKFIGRFLSNIQPESDIGSELSYALPHEFVAQFENMFRNLEKQQKSLNLSSFGVALTTLEEVFMKVGSDTSSDKPKERPSQIDSRYEKQSNKTNEKNRSKDLDINHTKNVAESDIEANNDEIVLIKDFFQLQLCQWIAMFKKRYFCWIRRWVLALLQNLVAIVFVIMSCIVVRSTQFTVLPDLDIDIKRYPKSVTMIQKPQSFNNSLLLQSIFNAYKTYINSKGNDYSVDEFSEDVETRYLRLAKTELFQLNLEYLMGLSIFNGEIIAWFNGYPYHTPPLSIDMVHNAIIKAKLGTEYSIHMSNHPIPFHLESNFGLLLAPNNMGFQLGSFVSFALAFVSSFYIIFYIKESVSKAKLLQYVSGLNVYTYWISSFLFDYVSFVFTSILMTITIIIFQETGWQTIYELAPAFLSILIFGFAVLPIIYLFSMLFSEPPTGFVRMSIFFIITGITLFISIGVLYLPEINLQSTASTLNQMLLIFPHYSLADLLNNLNIISATNSFCKLACNQNPACIDNEFMCQFNPNCCGTNIYGFERPGIGSNLIAMFGMGVFCFLLLLIVEYRIHQRFIYFILSFVKRNPEPMEIKLDVKDNDVINERNRINQMTTDDYKMYSLILKELTKFYGNFLAVNQISVAVESAECFGLIGVNGAGKTTTFKMLTGDEKISGGGAYVRGISLKSRMPDVHKMIGYCPQFDALIDDLTGAETLDIFARLRGIRPEDIPTISQQLAIDFKFLKHLNKKSGQYSGGNKRKLSAAVAMLGNPVIVYLDEPTTGMDPSAKRHLWDVVSKVRSSGKSIILTSHSMEECEALCTRLVIMVNGEFKCIGSPQHLKHKFSKGFTLTIKVKSIKTKSKAQIQVHLIKEYVQENFVGAQLMEEYQGLLTYQVPKSDQLKWSSMFGLMETAKEKLDIEDYSFSQTSLEQVFLSFTKYQREESNYRRTMRETMQLRKSSIRH